MGVVNRKYFHRQRKFVEVVWINTKSGDDEEAETIREDQENNLVDATGGVHEEDANKVTEEKREDNNNTVDVDHDHDVRDNVEKDVPEDVKISHETLSPPTVLLQEFFQVSDDEVELILVDIKQLRDILEDSLTPLDDAVDEDNEDELPSLGDELSSEDAVNNAIEEQDVKGGAELPSIRDKDEIVNNSFEETNLGEENDETIVLRESNYIFKTDTEIVDASERLVNAQTNHEGLGTLTNTEDGEEYVLDTKEPRPESFTHSVCKTTFDHKLDTIAECNLFRLCGMPDPEPYDRVKRGSLGRTFQKEIMEFEHVHSETVNTFLVNQAAAVEDDPDMNLATLTARLPPRPKLEHYRDYIKLE